MAIIATNHHQAEVKAIGDAMNATMTFSGAMFEMLATVYVYILMAAIREPIQNGVDAVKRKGLTAAEGVKVFLPTADNPVITVIDKGPGMTKAFMESTYLSFGSSTKASDNDAAGGLGVGRWAAYGYIRECYIVTCNAEDMVERTYFQFQGPNGTPQVQLAAEVPGKECGTRVYFPVKETDITEALRAVAWLKEVMQLTMGDSFSVDMPALLPKVLPDFCGTRLDLEEIDPSLKGVRIYPMQGSTLKYGRQGMQEGSLVVLTNQEVGVGGLPFHVQTYANWESVFFKGMIIEIPLAYNVPFMPSREELKYTDEVNLLMRRIDAAAEKLVVRLAAKLYAEPDLVSKRTLTDLLGNGQSPDISWHWFSQGSHMEGKLKGPLTDVTGKQPWQGRIKVKETLSMRSLGIQLKWISSPAKVMQQAYVTSGAVAVSAKSFGYEHVTFVANKPLTLVLNDLPAGGTGRFRNWLKDQVSFGRMLFVTAEKVADAELVMGELCEQFGHTLPLMRTSSLPEPDRIIVGSKVVKRVSRAGMVTSYSLILNKQKTDTLAFESYDPKEVKRVWLKKDGGKLDGFDENVLLSNLVSEYGEGSLRDVLMAMNVNKLYLLTPKQSNELLKAQEDASAEGLFDRTSDEFSEEEGGLAGYHEVCALKGWISLEDAIRELLQTDDMAALLDGRKVRKASDSYEFTQFCEAMARRPRLALTGTQVDKEFSPYIDFMVGQLTLHKAAMNLDKFNRACEGLIMLSTALATQDGDPDEAARQELIATLKSIRSKGFMDYNLIWKEMALKFPLLESLRNAKSLSEDAIEHACRALAVLYK